MEYAIFMELLVHDGIKSFNSHDGLFRFESKVSVDDLVKEALWYEVEGFNRNDIRDLAFSFYKDYFMPAIETYVRKNRFSKIKYQDDIAELKSYMRGYMKTWIDAA